MGVTIWQPAEVDGKPAFVRPPPLPFGDHHAAREVILAAKQPGSRRVCFFGESAAAGYLYAPHLTPALVLEAQLNAADGAGSWEVVDLARTNETLAGLVTAVEESVVLDPDVLVLFTGNNWNLLETPEVSPYHPEGRREYAAALRESGLAGPIEVAGRRRLRLAGTALAAIAGHGLPVVLVVPEVNLTDWEARQPAPWLPGGATGEWHRRYAAGRAALAAGAPAAARRHAERMLDLDGGLTPSPFRMLAAAGLDEAAEAEVAADHYAAMCFLGAPRAAPIDQEVQRRAARAHGFRLVDLPAIFRRHDPVPGRRLFLDYCHLTADGMRIAMAAVAAAVLGRDVPADPPGPAVPPAVEATARLGAAVHSAHRLLPVDPANDVIAHWLREALAADPSAADAMLDVVTARAAPVPEVLTPAQQRNLASPHRLGYQHGWRYDHVDAVLLDATARVLDGRVEPLLAGRAVGVEPVELVRPPEYLWEPAARFHPDVVAFADVTARAFLRCPWPGTRLALVAAGAADHELAITARLPGYGTPGGVAIAVNDRAVGQLPVGRRWATATVRVPGAALHPGLNRVELRWPELPPVGDTELGGVIERLDQGLPADVHPVFGELYSVRARRV